MSVELLAIELWYAHPGPAARCTRVVAIVEHMRAASSSAGAPASAAVVQLGGTQNTDVDYCGVCCGDITIDGAMTTYPPPGIMYACCCGAYPYIICCCIAWPGIPPCCAYAICCCAIICCWYMAAAYGEPYGW